MKCGNVFNLETFGGMTSWWIFPNIVLKGKPPLDKNSRRVVVFFRAAGHKKEVDDF